MYCYPKGKYLQICDEIGPYRTIELPGEIASAYLNEGGGIAVLRNGKQYVLEVSGGEVYPRPC